MPTAIYASNTSTIPIARIAEAAKHPERVLGMHFFSPVHKMPLLEVIVTPATDARGDGDRGRVRQDARQDGDRRERRAGLLHDAHAVGVHERGGRLLDEGASIDAIDAALVDFGFPVGPITLLDEVGIDVGGKVGHVLPRRSARAWRRRRRCVASSRRGERAERAGRASIGTTRTGRRAASTRRSTS